MHAGIRSALAGTVIGVAIAGLGEAVASPGEAETVAPEDVVLVYTAPAGAGCPDAAGFEAAILARAPAVRFRTGSGRAFTVTIELATDGALTGHITVAENGEQTDRVLSGSRCDDLATALALVVALAIDPEHVVPAPATTTPPTSTPTPTSTSIGPTTAVTTHVAPPPRPWSLTAVAGGGVAGGLAPGAMALAHVEARLEHRRLGHAAIALLLGTAEDATDAGDARFTLIGGRLGACWRSPWTVARACAHLDVGVIRGEGSGIVGGQAVNRLIVDPGVEVQLAWPTKSSVFGELRGGADVSLMRYRYYFNPDIEIHHTGAVVPWIAFGVGVRFR